MRRRRLLLEPLRDQEDERVPPFDFEMLAEERNRMLYQALNRISPDYRQVLYLLYFEEMEIEEAARVMRKSVRQVYNLSYRGKQALREMLARKGITDADV